VALAQGVKRASAKNQIVLFDVQYTYTKADADNSTPSKSHFYVKHDMLNPGVPKDWTSDCFFQNLFYSQLKTWRPFQHECFSIKIRRSV